MFVAVRRPGTDRSDGFVDGGGDAHNADNAPSIALARRAGATFDDVERTAEVREAFAALMKPMASDRGGYVADSVASSRVWASKRYFDESAASALAAASYDRGLCPSGTTRQLAAVLATGSVESDLARLRLPVLVIHGTDDTLITPSGGRRTADVIPGAELMIVTDMGHDRPEPLWPILWDAIVTHTALVRD